MVTLYQSYEEPSEPVENQKHIPVIIGVDDMMYVMLNGRHAGFPCHYEGFYL